MHTHTHTNTHTYLQLCNCCYVHQVLRQSQIKSMEQRAAAADGNDELDTTNISSSTSDTVATHLKTHKRHQRKRSLERVPVIADIETVLTDHEQYNSSKG